MFWVQGGDVEAEAFLGYSPPVPALRGLGAKAVCGLWLRCFILAQTV